MVDLTFLPEIPPALNRNIQGDTRHSVDAEET